ncbi:MULTISPECIES: ABC transporter substrate-binding protein [unclassified Candidatus Tisiphia]|uniref:ABC transporter substrate-binding protein n=1 Tax=unclassified Candidatus Tisiphia TaxID=2996318 RepID=UPI00312C7B25|nr:ABC transporter substrate-binding protein [Rickettsiaceae bacterium]MDD9337748.1 ABC transporter substrate-binding protein [Rickettsiaceae bacterium]
MKLIKLFFLVICCSFLMIGCDNQSKEQNLIVATSADNPPYEFIQNGQIVGFDIDIINAIGEQIGKKVIIKNFDFNGLLASLTTENVDIVIAGLSVTEERKKHISFSVPYISTNVSILYRSADNLKNTGDLDNKAVGVQLGTTWAVIVQDLAKQFNIRINYLSNNLMLVEELKSKVIDAVVLEASQSKKFIENNPDLASFGLTEFSSELAIAMPENSKLIDSVNKAIAELTEDGTISRITKKWLQQ